MLLVTLPPAPPLSRRSGGPAARPSGPVRGARPGPVRPRDLLARAGLPTEGLFWLAIGLSACSVLAGASLAPGLVEIARALGAEGAVWPRLLVSLPALGVPLGALAFTRFGAGLPERAVLLFAVLLYAAAGAAGALLGMPGPMLALRMLQGMTIAPMMLIALRWLGAGQDPRGALALQSVLMTGSTVVVLLASGLMAGIDWRLPFALNLAPLALIPAILTLAPAGAARPAATATTAAAPAEPAPAPEPQAGAYLPGLILAFVAMASFFAVPTQIAGALGALGAASAPRAAFLIILSVTAAALSGIALRRADMPRQTSVLVIAGFAAQALGFWQLALGGSVWMAMSGAALVGAGFGAIFPTLNHWAMAGRFGMGPGRAIAGITAAFHVGQFAAPLLGAAALRADGGMAVFVPYLLLALFGAGLARAEAARLDAALSPAAHVPAHEDARAPADPDPDHSPAAIAA